MTMRKPSSISFPDWVEHQVRTAQAEGAFENLPGAGKPIPDIDRPAHELAWVANYLRRENVDVAALLPPALALAKEVEVLPERLRTERSESTVRKLVEELNERIRTAHRQPQIGPPVRIGTVHVEDVVRQWRESSAAEARPARGQAIEAPAEPSARRHKRFGRRFA